MVRRFWERWKVIAHKIGDFQARLLLSIFYYLVFSQFALGVKLFSDPLMLKRRSFARWISKEAERAGPWERARRQY